MRKIVGLTLIKTLNDWMLLVYLEYSSLAYTKNANSISDLILIAIYGNLAPFYLATNLTYYYFGMSMMNFYLANLNSMLSAKIQQFNSVKHSKRNPYDECCQLSDFIDRIAVWHRQLINLNKEWVDLNGLTILVSLADAFVTLACKPFYLYTTIVRKQIGPNAEQLYNVTLFNSIIVFTSKLFQCVWLLSGCQEFIYTFRETGNIIHEVDVKGVDIRLKNSVKSFSAQLLQDPIKISPYGLFSMDYTLLLMIISSSTSYFIILVQFQIAV